MASQLTVQDVAYTHCCGWQLYSFVRSNNIFISCNEFVFQIWPPLEYGGCLNDLTCFLLYDNTFHCLKMEQTKLSLRLLLNSFFLRTIVYYTMKSAKLSNAIWLHKCFIQCSAVGVNFIALSENVSKVILFNIHMIICMYKCWLQWYWKQFYILNMAINS